jgi:hypothetical protein
MPTGTVGMRHWTIVLDSAAAVDDVRARLAGAGASVEDRPDGFLTRDPWNNAVMLTDGSRFASPRAWPAAAGGSA